MPSLKDLKNRINSVKATRKITSAMKMVAAAKLRRAQEKAEATRPYAGILGDILANITSQVSAADLDLSVLKPRETIKKKRYFIVSSDRGLCGGFNSGLARFVKKSILPKAGDRDEFVFIGRKTYDQLKSVIAADRCTVFANFAKEHDPYFLARDCVMNALKNFDDESVDEAVLVYNKFKSVMEQTPTESKLFPLSLDDILADNKTDDSAVAGDAEGAKKLYEFEPDKTILLEGLVPKTIAMQLYQAILESMAGEQGARMTAMDNATRNAGDMINGLTLTYNRTRQAQITKELIEIISGAEAV